MPGIPVKKPLHWHIFTLRAVSFRRAPRGGADGQRFRCLFPAQWVESGFLPFVFVLSDRGKNYSHRARAFR